ncbi:MAG: cbb3-type cytochrome oxidase assembly protein CcoS [Cyclobacteriaceae bacterium]|nr:cbb3-type cytochrome oxidase assembly protein CcoS [Cyclobacteriaceae bacterium]
MLIIVALILISVSVALIFLGAFFWAVKSGQYDDTYSPSVRMLFDDKKKKTIKDEDKNTTKDES